MGGEGSGRKPDPVKMLTFNNQGTGINNSMLIPNYSGIKTEAKKTSTYAARYLSPYHSSAPAVTSQGCTGGRVILQLIEVPQTVTADSLILVPGTAASGTVTLGIYGPVPASGQNLTNGALETCSGLPLIATTASTAQVVSGTNPQVYPLTTNPILTAGRYYLATEGQNSNATVMRHGNTSQVVGWVEYYDRAGGYGALTNPCPAITQTGSSAFGIRLKVTVAN